ncbi:xylose ABC transporter ATP-binding protein [Thermicanus aegyptius]|uniref:xylose ABC transporter ATP-binding protein n=1 Tax=Thermicanus aegyptius TaxID=94009 RepID=UPI00040C38BB|nr:xylose ABC transporter ATP-binding protein [Thermicanus aegyptius]
MNALEMIGITKEFPGVRALDQVTLSVKKGEIHALCGENGAGKSTLMKVLSGVYPTGTYEGIIRINGQEMYFRDIKESEKAGIAIIYQELTLVKEMTVAENIFLGNEPLRRGIIDTERLYEEAKKWLDQIHLDIPVDIKVSKLGIGQQQMVEIAKALSKKSEIIILDEPTAALTESEVKILMNLLRLLKSKGKTCIYISHKLNEVMSIADRVTVLRDGKTVGTDSIQNLTEEQIISLMVGREISDLFPYEEHEIGDVVLEVKNYSAYDPRQKKKIIDQVSFNVREGEILGIAGLMGAGRTELFASLFGVYKVTKEGEVFLRGKKIRIREPRDAIELGIVYASEDRKQYGLIMNMNIMKNSTLAALDRVMKRGIIDESEEVKISGFYMRQMLLKATNLEMKVSKLSGGNQQKVVLGKWLMTNPKVLILDEPTRGIDVGAKYEIYKLINELVKERVAVVMISSELPEIIGMSDRILVLSGGRIINEFRRGEATQEKIMASATGRK